MTGTRAAGPWTQIVPQCTSSGRLGRSASTSARAESAVKQIMSITASAPSAAIRSPNVAAALLGLAVDRDPLHRAPLGRGPIRLALAAAEGDHLVARAHEPRHEVGPDVARGPDDDDAAHARQRR